MPETSGPRGVAGRVAIVTGAARGIGLASATEMAMDMWARAATRGQS
jgi:NAD(P)-dependent dehydrogenase (short-subunit alcohol dehydrogenase family)